MKHNVTEKYRNRFLKPFLALSALGFIGVLAVVPTAVQLLRNLPELPELPLSVLVALSLIQPTLLLLASVAVGLGTAPRLGFTSHVAQAARGEGSLREGLTRDLPVAMLTALLVGMALILLELLLAPFLGEAAEALTGGRTVAVTFSGVLYGGLTEEILVRWGLLSLITWLLWRFVQRGRGTPKPGLVWAAIVLVALAFGALHLPATAGLVDLSLPVVLRALLLNGLGAMAFGWLFWRRSLEAAMVAHAGVHVVAQLATWIGVL